MTDIAQTTTDLSILAALDALEAGRADAPKLLAGLPCTVSIGSDSYAGRVIKATRCTITVVYGNSGTERTFRKTGDLWTNKGHYFLTLGVAETHYDLSH